MFPNSQEWVEFKFLHTSYGIVFVVSPEVFKFFLNVPHGHSSNSLLVVNFYIVSFEDKLHLTASAIIKGFPALAHHPIDSHVIP